MAEAARMTGHTVDGVEILLWSQRLGLSAYAAPWAFDLEYGDAGRAAIDASSTQLKDHPEGIDRYRALGPPELARVLKAALQRRDDFLSFPPGTFSGYAVRIGQPGIDEAAFLRIVAAFVRVWRRKNGLDE